jgi:hypothetical protein
MTTVKVEVDPKLLDAVNARFTWLCYKSASAFVRDAVTRRIEALASLKA